MDEKSNQSIWAKNIPMKEQWQIIKRLFSFFMYYKVQIIVAIIGAFLVSAINMLLPYGLQYFLDHFLLNQSATTQIILFAGLLYALVSIIKAILQFVYEYYYAVGAEYTLEKVRKVLYRKLHRLGMRYFDQTPAGSIVSRVTNDTMTLSSFLTVVNSTLMAIFSIITALIAMFMTNKIAGLLICLFSSKF